MLVWWLISLLRAEPLNPLSISLDREIEDQVLRQFQLLDEKQRGQVLQSFEDTVFPSAHIHYELGLQYYQKNNLSAAEEQYQEALKIDPAYTPALYDLAEILLIRGDTVVAKQYLTTLQQVGQHWVVSYRLAQIGWMKEKPNKWKRISNVLLEKVCPVKFWSMIRCSGRPIYSNPMLLCPWSFCCLLWDTIRYGRKCVQRVLDLFSHIWTGTKIKKPYQKDRVYG